MNIKGVWNNLVLGIIVQVLVTGVAYVTWGTSKYIPGMVLTFTLCLCFIGGRSIEKGKNKLLSGFLLVVPYFLGLGVYFLGKAMVSATCIKAFRLGFPQVYNTMEVVSSLIGEGVSRANLVVIVTVVVSVLSLIQFYLGYWLKNTKKVLGMFYYNAMLILSVYYCLVFFVTQAINWNEKIVTDESVHIVFASILAGVVFVVCMFIGKLSKKTSNKFLNVLSLSTVPVIASIMYGLVRLGLYQPLRYEMFVLPTANSLFGDISKKMSVMLGNNPTYIIEYGIVASILLWIIPWVLMSVGSIVCAESK